VFNISRGIYCIKNKINGKMYVGKSKNIEMRWKRHLKSSKYKKDKGYEYPLYRAIRKYGLINFEFLILELTQVLDLDTLEREYILKFDTMLPIGYNQVFGNIIQSIITPHTIVEVSDLLENTLFTNIEIAKMYNICDDSVGLINNGKTWNNPLQKYPLRKPKLKKPKIIKKNTCESCGDECNIHNKYKLCNKCYKKTQKSKLMPTRDILKDEIRNLSFVDVGKRYDVSDSAIKKWCRKHGLPFRASDIKKITNNEWANI